MSKDYQCFIVGYDTLSIGYFDFCCKNTSAELFGIYLEKDFRGNGIGQYLLRWITAYLRESHFKKLRSKIYEHNSV